VPQTKARFFGRWWSFVEPQRLLKNHLRTITFLCTIWFKLCDLMWWYICSVCVSPDHVCVCVSSCSSDPRRDEGVRSCVRAAVRRRPLQQRPLRDRRRRRTAVAAAPQEGTCLERERFKLHGETVTVLSTQRLIHRVERTVKVLHGKKALRSTTSNVLLTKDNLRFLINITFYMKKQRNNSSSIEPRLRPTGLRSPSFIRSQKPRRIISVIDWLTLIHSSGEQW